MTITPDTELIRLCDEMLASHAHYRQIDATKGDAQLWEAADNAIMIIPDQIDTMTPVTPAGIRAKARAADVLWRMNGPPDLEVHGMLAMSLIEGLAKEPADEPDAELVRLSDETMLIQQEADRISEAADGLSFRESERIRATEILPRVRHQWDLRAKLAKLRATTPAGLRAKARVIQAINNCAPASADPYHEDALAWSLANDLLGVESVWAPDWEEPDALREVGFGEFGS